MKVILTNEIGLPWGTPEELAAMSDEELWEMVCDDLLEFVNGSEFTVVRAPESSATQEREGR